MRKNIIALTVAVLLAPLSVAHAAQGYQGPTSGAQGAPGYGGQVHITKVKDLSGFGFGDRHVIIQGRLVNRVGAEHFTFADDTGSVTVELDDDIYLPNVNEKTTVRLFGEYDGGFGAEFEADYVEVISQS